MAEQQQSQQSQQTSSYREDYQNQHLIQETESSEMEIDSIPLQPQQQGGSEKSYLNQEEQMLEGNLPKSEDNQKQLQPQTRDHSSSPVQQKIIQQTHIEQEHLEVEEKDVVELSDQQDHMQEQSLVFQQQQDRQTQQHMEGVELPPSSVEPQKIGVPEPKQEGLELEIEQQQQTQVEKKPQNVDQLQHQEEETIQESKIQSMISRDPEVLQCKTEESEKSVKVQEQSEVPQQSAKTSDHVGHQKVEYNHGKDKELPNKQKCQNEPNQGHKDKNQAKQNQEQQSKKQKTGVVGENYERINYLVQTSRALVKMGESEDESVTLNFDKALASQTGSLATAVGRRCLIRLSPSLKRMLCKGCGTALIYGVNAKVRHRSNRQKHLVITCLTCYTIKRLVNNPKHKLWCEQEEAVL